MAEVAARRSASSGLGRPDERVHCLGGHHGGGHTFRDRNVDVLTLAGIFLHEQRHGGGCRAVQSTLVLSLETAVLQRFPVLEAADAHDQAHSVADDLLAGILASRAPSARRE